MGVKLVYGWILSLLVVISCLSCFSKSVILFSMVREAGGGYQFLSFLYIWGTYSVLVDFLLDKRYCLVRIR